MEKPNNWLKANWLAKGQPDGLAISLACRSGPSEANRPKGLLGPSGLRWPCHLSLLDGLPDGSEAIKPYRLDRPQGLKGLVAYKAQRAL